MQSVQLEYLRMEWVRKSSDFSNWHQEVMCVCTLESEDTSLSCLSLLWLLSWVIWWQVLADLEVVGFVCLLDQLDKTFLQYRLLYKLWKTVTGEISPSGHTNFNLIFFGLLVWIRNCPLFNFFNYLEKASVMSEYSYSAAHELLDH